MDSIITDFPPSTMDPSSNSSDISTPSSNLSSYFTTSPINTQATTPGVIVSGAYQTILVTSENLGNIKAVESAFVEFEPFKNFNCAFCSHAATQFTCKCQTLTTIESPVPTKKRRLLKYLEREESEAGHIQAATLAYLLVLEKHIPFGPSFNADQQAKCSIMHRQLEDVKKRISDIRIALNLLKDDKSTIPAGILQACNQFRPVLATCLGNARENHICFKLNFKLFTK